MVSHLHHFLEQVFFVEAPSRHPTQLAFTCRVPVTQGQAGGSFLFGHVWGVVWSDQRLVPRDPTGNWTQGWVL